MLSALFVFGIALGSPPLGGADLPYAAEGYWVALDPYSMQRRYIIKVDRDINGLLEARIVKVMTPGKQPSNRCLGCPGRLDGQPLKDLTIGWGFKRTAKKGEWTEGFFVYPDTRTLYKCRLSVHPGGRKAKISGYKKGSWQGWGMLLVRRDGP